MVPLFEVERTADCRPYISTLHNEVTYLYTVVFLLPVHFFLGADGLVKDLRRPVSSFD